MMKIGVKASPELLAGIFRNGGHTITEGIPDEFKLRNYGYDHNLDEFYFIFECLGCPEGIAVEKWITPEMGALI